MEDLFLDANAHLPLNQKAAQAFIEFNNSIGGHGNAMAASVTGRAAANSIENSRKKIAELIGAKSADQIIFTSTCTQACEWGLEILKAQNFPMTWCSQIEHPAVGKKVAKIFNSNDLFTSKNGIAGCTFEPDEGSAFICIHVQNEVGTIQPIEDIKVPFFCDMSQSLGRLPLNVSKIPNLKIATFAAHKFGGPVGVSFMYIQNPDWWIPFGTGSRYHRDRAGTPDPGMIVATAVALEEALSTLDRRYSNAIAFSTEIEHVIKELGFTVIGDGAKRLPHITFFQIGKKMGPYVVNQFEAERIHIGKGSACGSLTSNSSPVMAALGSGGSASDFIRISQWGNYSEKEALRFIKTLKKYCPNH